MKKIIFVLALLGLLGMGAWGAVSVATADDSPEPLPAVVVPALSDAAERTAERAERRAATMERWRAEQERARIAAEGGSAPAGCRRKAGRGAAPA